MKIDLVRLALFTVAACGVAVPVRADDVQLEAGLSGGSMGIASLGALGFIGGLSPDVRVGWAATERLVLLTGLDGGYSSTESEDGARGESFLVSVPLEAKLYLTTPETGSLAPLFRATIAYGYARTTFQDQESTSHRGSVGASLGAEHWATDHFGVSAEGGLSLGRGFGEHALAEHRSWSVDTTWRLSVVLRD